MSKKLLIICFLVVVGISLGAYFFTKNKPLDGSGLKTAQSKSSEADTASKVPSLPAPPDEAETKQVITEIRSELQAIMQLNEKLNQAQSSKTDQLLKIQEQAGVHQRLLAKIEQIQATTVKKAIPSRDALLVQEKLRVIREESLRNKKDLEKIQLSSKTS